MSFPCRSCGDTFDSEASMKIHHNWKAGQTSSYGRGWTEIRRMARERDNFTCQVCKRESNECYGPEVHHIKPVREFDDIEDAHFLDNVICLCRKCHVNADHDNISRTKLKRKI